MSHQCIKMTTSLRSIVLPLAILICGVNCNIENDHCDSANSDHNCHSKWRKDEDISTSINCDNFKNNQVVIELKSIEEPWPDQDLQNHMFFVESSGRDHLLPRQTCAVESAIRNARLGNMIVTMTSKSLNITANNATCQLFNRYGLGNKMSGRRIYFRHVDVDSLFIGTPIDNLHKADKFETGEEFLDSKSILKIVHYSDAIRLLLVHKFGGWYSDLDMVIIKALDKFKNVLGCDNKDEGSSYPEDFLGLKVSNAIFHNEKGHALLTKAIEVFPRIYTGQWASGGPQVLSVVLDQLCGKPWKKYLNPAQYNPENCHGVTVVEPQ